MIELINGRGQLGSVLKRKVEGFSDLDCVIYHTWNIDDKSEITQLKEYEKFKDFVNSRHEERIVFISTVHAEADSYLKYKMLSEIYLWDICDKGKVIRLPAYVGKGKLYEKCRKGIKPIGGWIHLSTLDHVSDLLLNSLFNDSRLEIIDGDNIDVDTVYELIQYGAKK